MRFDSLNRTCLRLIAKLAYDLNTNLYACVSSEAFISQLYFDYSALSSVYIRVVGSCTVKGDYFIKFFLVQYEKKEQSCFYLFGRPNLFDATTKSDDFVPTIQI